jgi:hypothetical protein
MSACARLVSSVAAVMFMATALGAAQGDAAATAAVTGDKKSPGDRDK